MTRNRERKKKRHKRFIRDSEDGETETNAKKKIVDGLGNWGGKGGKGGGKV